MNLTFWLTEKCNLNCKYCYVNKVAKTMKVETAKQAMDCFSGFFSKSVDDNKRINISLHGGEPLLNFEVLKYIVERMKKTYGDMVRFTMTTNGTVFDKKSFDYLLENVQISISIDGDKRTNDINRIYANGKSSFEEVVRTLHYIQDKSQMVRIRMTVTRETIKDLADNYIYLDALNLGIVTFSLDLGECWDANDIEVYYKNYTDIMEYLISKSLKEAQYFLQNIKEATFRRRKSCDGGTNTFHISAEGSIYPCSLALEKTELLLGDVNTGIEEEKLQKLQKINEVSIVGCENCGFQKNCSSSQ